MKKIILTFLIFVCLTGCVTVPMAPTNQDKIGKQFIPNKNKASIYVFRNENFGTGVKANLFLDGSLVGQTATYTYVLLKVRPGNHTISSSLENTAQLNLYTESGKVYFIKQKIQMGALNPRVALHQFDSIPGQTGVMKCKLIAPMKNAY
jgi:hypothetical protein